MGIDHVKTGGLLAEQWQLPNDIIYTILHHHDEHGDDPIFSINGS